MKVHVHWKESGQTKHYWPGSRSFLVIELGPGDREQLMALPEGQSVVAFASEDWSDEDVRAVLNEIATHRTVRLQPVAKEASLGTGTG